MKKHHSITRRTLLPFVALVLCGSPLLGLDLAITNAGFEDTSGQSTYNEFTFGVPVGWSVYDPSGITGDSGVYHGTLEPNGTDFFPVTAPEGDRVAIFFNSGEKGSGEYGFTQTLAEVLSPNTRYTLTVQVGNITSGTDEGGTAYDLSNFPGYRVDFIAGGSVIASDDDSLTIAEGAWETSTVTYTTGSTVTPGQNIGIRLVNLNATDEAPDNEVDFDDVQLTAVAVPEPRLATLLVSLFSASFLVRRRR